MLGSYTVLEVTNGYAVWSARQEQLYRESCIFSPKTNNWYSWVQTICYICLQIMIWHWQSDWAGANCLAKHKKLPPTLPRIQERNLVLCNFCTGCMLSNQVFFFCRRVFLPHLPSEPADSWESTGQQLSCHCEHTLQSLTNSQVHWKGMLENLISEGSFYAPTSLESNA